jgi:hypothetical protein
MRINNVKELLSSYPIMNKGKELIEVIHLRANELGIEKEITCKISSNILPILTLTPGFIMNKNIQVEPEYMCGTYNNITFIVSAYLDNSIDILEN